MGIIDIFKPKPTQKDRMLAEFDLFIDELMANECLEPIQVDIILRKDEYAFLEASAALHETRSVRYHRNSGRIGFRVMKGVYYATGSSGVSESQQEQRLIDKGVLTLTNQRFIFNGFKENRVVPPGKVFSIEQFTDGIGLSSETRAKTLYLLGINSLIWKAVYEMITRTGTFGSGVIA